MTSKHLLKLKVLEHGEGALQSALERVRHLEEAGDTIGLERAQKEAEAIREVIEEMTAQDARLASISPNEVTLFAGLSHVSVPDESFQIMPGLSLENVYAHVMAPYLVAFNKAPEGRPHPGYLRSASGGLGFDINMQVVLDRYCHPTNFDRLNTIWWLCSLLRLLHATGIRVPILSDTSFFEAEHSTQEPKYWTIEMEPSSFAFDGAQKNLKLPTTTLYWLKTYFQSGANLMSDEGFRLAFGALAGAQRSMSMAESLILIWSSLEALFRPGNKRITHRLSLAIATYLEDDLRSRDRLFADVKRLYEVRSNVTHAAKPPNETAVLQAFQLSRKCFLRTLERGRLPDFSDLEVAWKNRTTYPPYSP